MSYGLQGDIEETDESDDHIENVVATARLTLPPDTFEGLGFLAGVSYVNNIADSAGLEGDDGVGGALISYSLADNVGLSLEYLTGEFEDKDERDQLTSQLAIEW